MIVLNEELTIGRVLSSARTFANEIIVVDTGSTDRTREICLEHNCKLFSFTWQYDFAAARNFAFGKASGDYLMWLDADDVITPDRAKKLKELVSDLSCDIVMLPYYMGEPPTLTFWRERILKRSMNFTFSGRVHEAIELRGKIVYADIPVVHDKLKSGEMGRNLHIYELMQSEGHAFTGRDAFYYGSELYYNGMSCKAAIMLKSFIDGIGTPADKGQASLYLSRCVKSEQRKECLLNGLSYAFAPDLCCELGDYFISVGELGNAKNCFLSALVADEKITFPSPDCLRLIPYLRLCYCYWHLGDKNKSKHYNDLAVELAPSDKRVLYNFALFGN